MNRHSSRFPAASKVPCAAIPVPCEARAPATYSFRTTDCEHCDHGCSECVRGEVDAACADCGNVYPLNDDGVCEWCADQALLSTPAFHAKWLCQHVKTAGWRVEL